MMQPGSTLAALVAQLTPRHFLSDEQTREVLCRAIMRFGWALILGLAIIALAEPPRLDGLGDAVFFWMALVEIGAVGTAMLLARRGQFELAVLTGATGVWVFLAALIIQFDGVHDSAMMAFPALILISGLLLSPGFATVLAALSIGFVLAVSYAERTGLLHNRFSALRDTTPIDACIIIVVTLTFIRVIVDQTFRAKARLRATFEQAPVGILHGTIDSRLLSVNRRLCAILGEDETSLVGRSYRDLLHPDDRPAFDAALVATRTEQTEITWAERRYVRRDGSIVWGEVTAVRITDAPGEPPYVLLFLHDVTERKRTEQAVREGEERFRALIEHSSDMVAVLTPEGVPTYLSPSWLVALGWTMEDGLGVPVFNWIHPDDRTAARHHLAALTDYAGGTAADQSRMRHRDGTYRHIGWIARNAVTVPGVRGLIINARDITGEKLLGEQLQQARKMEAIGQLAGGIAHDFNNILGAILGFADFLVQDLPGGSAEAGFAQRIVSAGHRARDLVQQILTFARKSAVERAPTDLVPIIAEAHDLLRASLPASTEFVLQLAGRPLVADVNATQISQIILNLCVNANDALQGSPGRVTLRLEPVAGAEAGPDSLASFDPEPSAGRVITGRLDPTRSYAGIVVTDSGSGIPPEILPHIFDPFFTTKNRGRGTGLGLAVVHGIVAEYDGACRVESRAGLGTRFSIYLPLAERQPSRQLPAGGGGPPLGRERLLVVDDEPALRELLQIGLARLGYAVTVTGDALEALALLEADPAWFDVVISDQNMPKLTGLAMLERLKALAPAIRFILCTGYSDIATEEIAATAGADGFFIKPILPTVLALKIRQICDRAA